MALVVEDGTARSDAEALASVTAYKAYCDARGIDYSVRTDTQIEQDLRKGCDYMLQAYRLRWAGVRRTITQAQDWPRELVPIKDAPAAYPSVAAYYANDIVPTAVQNANIALAIKSQTATLNPDLTQALLAVKAGSVAVDYDPRSPQVKRYREIDMLLAPLLKSGGGTVVLRS